MSAPIFEPVITRDLEAPLSILVTVTPENLAAAFDEWLRRYEADRSAFAEEYGDSDGGYGADCANFLIGLLSEQVTS